MFAANLFAKLWRDDEEPVHKLIITDRCLEIFTNKHDSIQHQLKDVAGTDELLSGTEPVAHNYAYLMQFFRNA